MVGKMKKKFYEETNSGYENVPPLHVFRSNAVKKISSKKHCQYSYFKHNNLFNNFLQESNKLNHGG